MSEAKIGESPLADGRTPGDAPMPAYLGTAAWPTVSVVVCSYTADRWENLSRAISSIEQQTEAAHEIVLVIDHCPELLERSREVFASVIAVPNRFDQGLSGSRNTGVAQAGGDVVAFLDDDAVADPTWIARLAERYRDPRVLGVGGLVEPSWENGRPPWFPPELDWVVGCSYEGMPLQSEPVRNFIGANMSFRREILEELCGFTAALGRVGSTPLGCEETELCLRASRLHPNGVLLYEPSASVSHTVPKQRATWSYLVSRCYAEGLSKAKVAAVAGTRRALSSERSYLRSVIPRGVTRSLADAARGELAALGAALAILAAVAMTSTGYLTGRMAGLTRDLTVPAFAAAQGEMLADRVKRAGGVLRATRIADAGRSALVTWGGLVLCLALWGAALAGVHVTPVATANLGLISVLPVTFWAALVVFTISFCWSVARRSTGWPILAAHSLALIVLLNATPALVYGTLRYSWAWKHVGVVDFISHHGIKFNLGGVLGAYQGWPGFFALNSFLTEGSGLNSALGYAPWAVPVNHLLWLGPFILIARTFTNDQRLIWTGAVFFEVGNWVGQDYFSPQAFAYFLYLTVIAICLRWLWPRQTSALLAAAGAPQARSPAVPADRPGPTRAVIVICLLPLLVAIASSHQLTPFMLIGALTILAVFHHLRPRMLPAAMAVITVGWLAYAGRPWLSANRSRLLDGLGNPWANTSAHLVSTSHAPMDQTLVDWSARGISAVIGVLAVIGFRRYWHRHDRLGRRSWIRVALLVLAAVPVVAANNYGGEVIFRAYLFALPFLAIAGAAAFFPDLKAGRSIAMGLALLIPLATLMTGFALGNYGKEAMNYFTPREVAASAWLYRTAPPGSQLVAATSDFPWGFAHYSQYSYTFLDEPPSLGQAVLRAPVRTVTRIMRVRSSPASYLILTRSQEEGLYLTGTWPANGVSRVTDDLLASGKYRVVYRNADVTVLQLSQAAGSALARAPSPRDYTTYSAFCSALDEYQNARHLPDRERIPGVPRRTCK